MKQEIKALHHERQLTKKKIGEARAKRLLVPLFAKLNFDLGIAIENNQDLPSILGFRNSLVNVLENHYEYMRLQFQDEVFDQAEINRSPVIIGASAAFFETWKLGRAERQSGFMTRTALRTMASAKARAIAKIIEATQAAPRAADVARAAKKIARPLFGQQVATAAVTETQAAAESTKQGIASAAQGTDRELVLIKTWFTELDERVRAWHQEAEGQERPVEIPFTVGGQQLMFPADTNLNATLANIVRCRCSALYERVKR